MYLIRFAVSFSAEHHLSAVLQLLLLMLESNLGLFNNINHLRSAGTCSRTSTVEAALHAGSFVTPGLLILGSHLLFLLTLAATPALIKLPLWKHLPRCGGTGQGNVESRCTQDWVETKTKRGD